MKTIPELFRETVAPDGQLDPQTLEDVIRLTLAHFCYADQVEDAYGKLEMLMEVPGIPAPVRNQLEAALGEADHDFARMHVRQALMLAGDAEEKSRIEAASRRHGVDSIKSARG